MADPGFLVGGVDLLGGVDLRCGHFSVKMYMKTKESGPIAGRGGGHAPDTHAQDPPMPGPYKNCSEKLLPLEEKR